MALPSTPYDPLFQQAGEKHGVDPAILKAIASVESDFRPDAVGPRTRSGQAKGMMQFIPATAKAYGLEDPFNPEQSVDAAARLMKDLLRQFNGDVGSALEAYNGGPRLVGKSKQTAAYRQKVLQRAKLTDSTQFAAKTPPATDKVPPVSQQMPPVRDRVALSSVEDLPAGYKAAIALQYFTDLDPEGNPIESAEQTLAELREARELDSIAEAAPSGGGALLQKFFAAKNKGSVSPFDIMAGMQQEEQPTDQGPTQVAEVQGFADGGFAFRGTSLPAMPNPYLNMQAVTYTPEEQAFINAQKAIIPDIDAYNSQLDTYKAQVDAYNKRVQELTPEVEKYNQQLADYERQVDAYNAQVELWNKHFVNATPGHEYFYYYLNRHSLNPDAIFASKNPEPVFTAQAPDFGPEPVAPTVPLPKGYTQAQYDQYVNQINAKQGTASPNRKLAEQQELALDVVSDPGKYNLAGFGFSEGGAADKQGMLEKVKRFIVENDLTPADFMLTPRTIPLGMMLQPTEANAGEAEMLERYRRMAEQEQGKVVNRAEGSGSRGEEVPRLDASGRVVLPEPTPEEERSLLEQLYGLGEAGLGAVTGMASAIPGSLYGAYKGLTSDKYGTPEGVREAEAAAGNVMEAMTFTPRGEAGKEYLQEFSQMIPQELMGAMPQSQLMNVRVAPGAAKYLGDRAVEATERGVMPIIRSQTENPDLQPADVYGAMLANPAENVAGAAATYAVRPGGGDVFTGPDFDVAGFRRKARESLMNNLYDEEIEAENLALGEFDAILKDPYLDTTDRYQLPLEQGMFADSPFAKYQEAFNFIQSPLFNEKANKYITTQYGSPNDPLYKAYMRGEYSIASPLQVLYKEQFANDEVEKIIRLRERQHELLNTPPEDPNVPKDPYGALSRDEELGSIEYELTAAYDSLTPFKINMGAGTLGARLQNDMYRADLVDRLIDFERSKAADAERDIGKGFLEYFNKKVKETNAVDRLDEQLKKLGDYFVKNEDDGLIADTMQEGKAKTKFIHPVFLTKEYGIDLSDLHAVPSFARTGFDPLEHYAERFKKALDEQLVDEIQSKVEEQGGIFTGAFTRLSRNYNTPLENVGASERGRPTLTPGTGVAPIDFNEVVEYLAKTPRKDYENKTFPEIVLAAHRADFYKDIKNPIKIAQRADRYQALTPEQRFTGTVPWREDFSPNYFDDLKGSSIKGVQWREINSRGGIKVEGRLLRHCLSLNPEEISAYERKLQYGKARFFTLRDKKGKSYVTIEINPNSQDGDFNIVNQIKGKGNSAVGEKYSKEIEAFLDEYQRRELKNNTLYFNEDWDFVPKKYHPKP